MILVAGVDSSTQSTKVEVRELHTGAVVAQASAPHPPARPPASEQDPAAWWRALALAFEQVSAEIRSHISAIGVAGQQHGLVLVGSEGPLRPAKLWNDTTSAPQADALVDRLGPDGWAKAVGSVPVAAFTITKLAWVVEHEPELIERVERVMLPHDWLTWRLCDEHVTDRGDASGTGWFDPVRGDYRPELLDAAGVDGTSFVERLPRIMGPTEVAGQVTTTAAAELGLAAGVVVAPGSGDNMAAALGLGLDAGDVVISLGTSGVAYARSSTPTRDTNGAVAGFADATGGFLPLVCTLNATKVTDTVAAWLDTDIAGLAELALSAVEDPGEVTVVPWFDGERTPNRPEASGTALGLRTDTTRPQLALAAHDGVLCGLLHGVEALARCGVATDGTMRLIGGGARSVAYRQRLADLWQRPIVVPDADETVATGAAVQAATIICGAGDLDSVAASWGLGAGTVVEPNIAVDAAAIRDRYRDATND